MKNIQLIAAAAILLCSCSATKTIGPVADLNGEWDIVKVDGKAIDTTKTEFRPTLGFETAKNNVFGCAGCNSIMGTARVNKEANHRLLRNRINADAMRQYGVRAADT